MFEGKTITELWLQGGALAVLVVGAAWVIYQFINRGGQTDAALSGQSDKMADAIVQVAATMQATNEKQTDAVLGVISTLQDSLAIQRDTMIDLQGRMHSTEARLGETQRREQDCEHRCAELVRTQRQSDKERAALAERLDKEERRTSAMLRQRRREREVRMEELP